MLAEPTSTTGSPPAAESSTADGAECCSPLARPVSVLAADWVPPVAAEVQVSDTPEPEPSAGGSPVTAGAEPVVPDSPETLPWTVMRPPAPDSPLQITPQSSPGSEDPAAERGGGRRRRKPVSYAEPNLNK